MFSEWDKLVTEANAIWFAVAATLLALVFLGLWLRARAHGSGAQLRKKLKTARNEIALLRGDVIQAKRERAAEVEELTKELDTLRTVAGGRVPPELEQWKQRALEAERQLESDRERHQAEIEKVLTTAGSASSADQTMFAPIAPSGAREHVERLEQDLAEARQELEAATKKYETELTLLAERLNAEKAEALAAQAERHAAELEALQSRLDAVAGEPKPEHSIADEVPPAAEPDLPDSTRFAFLQIVVGADEGKRFDLPYDVATIGRSDSNTIVLQETKASRAHAEIRFDGVDFMLTDLNSTNGTLLNDALVTSSRLAFGDLIGIGETRLKFTCEAIEAAPSDPSFAAAAFRAMLRDAPRCRSAMRGLIDLLEQSGQHEEETRELVARLQDLDGGGTPSETTGSDDQHLNRPERTQ
jgi:pSer/pThr/pTyr-binding forkhead associated (FHA) protein